MNCNIAEGTQKVFGLLLYTIKLLDDDDVYNSPSHI